VDLESTRCAYHSPQGLKQPPSSQSLQLFVLSFTSSNQRIEQATLFPKEQQEKKKKKKEHMIIETRRESITTLHVLFGSMSAVATALCSNHVVSAENHPPLIFQTNALFTLQEAKAQKSCYSQHLSRPSEIQTDSTHATIQEKTQFQLLCNAKHHRQQQ
jgi:hypothetical protein